MRTGVDFFEFRKDNPDIAEKIIFTGMIDEYFDYRLGALSTVPYVLRQRCWTVITIRGMLWSTILTVKCRTRG